MLAENSQTNLEDGWADRSEYWCQLAFDRGVRRKKRERNSNPLILCGHGISMRVGNGALEIKNGFTHYPQPREQFRFFPGDLDTPRRIVLVDGTGSLSFAVMDWLQEQGVDFIRVDWRGESYAVLGGSGSPTDAKHLRWQYETAASLDKKVAFASDLIQRKITASRDTLHACFSEAPNFEKSDRIAAEGIERLASGKVATIDDILAVEGQCASAYFDVWRGLELSWQGEARNPVPPLWRTYGQRSSILTGVRAKNRKAAHPINAMLNYGYAMLEADTRTKIIANGYDPRIGLIHGGSTGNDNSFVFDLMEPSRPVIDRAVLDFALCQRFSAKDFILRKDGVCRSSPQLARALVTVVGQVLHTVANVPQQIMNG